MEKVLKPEGAKRWGVSRGVLQLRSCAAQRIAGVLLVLALGGFSCSKEYESPVSFHRELLGTPENLESEFADGRRILLRWTMSSFTNVAGYVVSMSATTRLLKEVRVDTTGYVEESSFTDTTLVDSVWYFFQVSAVDTNLFRGPPSLVDSVLVP